MKGILAYQAFNQIHDTYVDESYIPGAEVLLAPPARRTRSEREESPIRRFANSGWGVACISMFVALTVLAGIIYAGHRDPTGIPPAVTPSESTEAGTLSVLPETSALITEERALEIASDYWGIQTGDTDPDNGYRYRVRSQGKAKTPDNESVYVIALQWLVENQHYSTVTQVWVNEVTGEVVIPYADSPDTTAGPETVYPDEPIVEPDMEAILDQAEPMTPDIPEGSAFVGETALTMWYSEDGSRLQKRVSRIAVYRDGDDPYTHYLYADVLESNGKIRKADTTAIQGFFVLLESDTQLILATVEGEPIDQGNCTVSILIEAWLSWTDADNMSGEDLGDIRLQRVEYETGTWNAPLEKLDKTLVKNVGRVWDELPTRLRHDGGEENAGVLVDFFTVTDTPRVYAHADSKGADAAAARDRILDGSYFETAWSAFARRITDQAAGKDPAPPIPEETTNWEDYAEPMEPDVPDTAVVMGYTYTTDSVTQNGETFAAISRIALYGFREDESEFFLYRDVLDENGQIIASDTRLLPTLFGLAQSSLDGSLQLYTVTAGRKSDGNAHLGLTVQGLHWSDVSPTGEPVGAVQAWCTPCEEASWTWEESNQIMANKGMDYGWQVHAFVIGDCWLQNTQTYWNQALGELGMEGSGYLTFLLDKLTNIKLGDMYVLHPEDDEETRMGTYFFLSTGTDHLNRWFQFYMSGLGFRP